LQGLTISPPPLAGAVVAPLVATAPFAREEGCGEAPGGPEEPTVGGGLLVDPIPESPLMREIMTGRDPKPGDGVIKDPIPSRPAARFDAWRRACYLEARRAFPSGSQIDTRLNGYQKDEPGTRQQTVDVEHHARPDVVTTAAVRSDEHLGHLRRRLSGEEALAHVPAGSQVGERGAGTGGPPHGPGPHSGAGSPAKIVVRVSAKLCTR